MFTGVNLVHIFENEAKRGSRMLAMGMCFLFFSGCDSIDRNVYQEVQKIHAKNTSTTESSLKIPNFSKPSRNDEFTCSRRLEGTVDLYDLLDLAFENNSAIRVAWHQICIAQANKNQLDSAFWPQVSVGLKKTEVKQLGSVSGERKDHLLTAKTRAFFPEINISYSIFQFGTTREKSLAALDFVKFRDFQFSQALQDVAYAVQTAYFDLDSALATVKANEENLNDASVSLEAAQIKFNAGLASKQDVLKAKTVYSSATYELENSRATVESARAHLTRAVGIPISEDFKIETGQLVLESSPILSDVKIFLDEALKSRKDLQAQEVLTHSKEHQLKSQKYSQFPELFVSASLSSKRVHGYKGDYSNYSLCLGAQWDIFDGFYKSNAELMAREELKAQQQSSRSKIIDIESEVWDSFHTLKSSIQKMEAAKQSEIFALESFDCAKESYQAGLCSFTDFLTAQSLLASARRQRVCAHNDLQKAWVKMSYVTGKILEK